MPKDPQTLLEKYLRQYGEAETDHIPDTAVRAQYVLVIPAYQEAISQIEAVIERVSDVLVILVVNSPEPLDIETNKLLADIQNQWRKGASNHQLTWYHTTQNHPVLVVDRCSQPIDVNQGVGKARKIGADIALKLIENGTVATSWIFNTDADARLPASYFKNFAPENHAFQLYPFQHDGQDDAAALYEFSLLWYAYGLKFADSAYAFPTIGSTISFHPDAYVKVRGYPLRPAGEDFYLLNKLNKIGSFSYTKSEPIILSSRRSGRVPFGTGPGLKRIDQLSTPLAFEFYHPNVFVELKSFIKQLHESYSAADLSNHFTDAVCQTFTENNNLLPLLKKQQKQSRANFEKFIDDWFDGFRTLKFIHLVRERTYPSVTFSELWQSPVLPSPCPGVNSGSVRQASTRLLAALASQSA